MKSIYRDTFRQMEKVAETHSTIAVGYSGGKDSLVVLDVCCKVFPVVRAFFMYCVPGLEVCEAQMRFAKDRWGVDVVQIPHFWMMNAMKEGLWCDVRPEMDKAPELKLRDGMAYGMEVTGCKVMADGMKDADGLKRRQFFANIRDGGDRFWDRLHHPIREWKKRDVLDYLRVNNIPVPDAEKGAVTTGVGLNHDSLCWLHDKHPEDFKRLLRWYPYAGACIERRRLYEIA